MGDINYRIRSFYDRGRQDMAKEITDYLERVAEHCKDTPIKKDENLGRVIKAISDAVQKQMGVQEVGA